MTRKLLLLFLSTAIACGDDASPLSDAGSRDVPSVDATFDGNSGLDAGGADGDTFDDAATDMADGGGELDGEDWSPDGSAPLGIGGFVAVGDGRERVSSVGGYFWEGHVFEGDDPGDADVIRDVAYGGGLWVALDNGSRAYVSSDGGLTWRDEPTTLDGEPGHGWVGGLIYAEGHFYGAGGNQLIMRSTDGVAWESVNRGRSPHFRTIGYGDGLWIAAGDAGVVSISENGTDWETQIVDGPGFQGIAYGDGVFVLVGHEGRAVVYRGVEFDDAILAAFDSFRDVVYAGDGLFHVVGDAYVGSFRSEESQWEVDRTPVGFMGAAFGLGPGGEGLLLGATRGGSIWYSTDGFSWDVIFEGGYKFRDIAFGNY